MDMRWVVKASVDQQQIAYYTLMHVACLHEERVLIFFVSGQVCDN